MKHLGLLLWALVGAGALGVLASSHGEPVSAAWLLLAAACAYVIGYRYYSRWLARDVFQLEPRRQTPAHRLENGHDYVPTGRFVVFGHHFAAIAGAGPLVGPILAAQYGFLPGALWILVGVVLAGAVQDFVILAGSMRRDGKSLGQMAKDELGPVVGWLTLVAIFLILVILIAVLALVVVKALAASPWGTFTLTMTIPIALLVGYYMRVLRPGKVIEASSLGLVLLLVALVGGQWVAASPVWGPLFTLDAKTLAIALMVYGFAASVLPVWLLLAPRDYLSTFVKVGTVALMAVGVLVTLPTLQLPAVTRFVDGSGPVVAGPLWPFCFLTIACGAISGFHALVCSGTSPKLLDREDDARLVGYGGMLMESFVAIMALVAAASLSPGVYFAVNAPLAATGATPELVAATVSGWGFPLRVGELEALAKEVGETSLYHRTGGAPTFALGVATIFGRMLGGPGMLGLWYHFAIMFEALFILTTIDAGTRVGRFLMQDLFAQVSPRWGETSWQPGVWLASALVVAGWGTFLYQGVVDPLGGINSLWPLFGLANQLLAAIALAVGTTILLKMGRGKVALVTGLPLVLVAVITFWAGAIKVFDPDPRLGFLAHRAVALAGKLPAALQPQAGALARNDLLNASMALVFMAMTVAILALSARRWWAIASGRERPVPVESPPVYHPEPEVAV
ncbi:MAG: cstA [Cyanobacteria bacterium RYN_339]|nr:cstA [Cyanobacteria bacterium RYN_339]